MLITKITILLSSTDRLNAAGSQIFFRRAKILERRVLKFRIQMTNWRENGESLFSRYPFFTLTHKSVGRWKETKYISPQLPSKTTLRDFCFNSHKSNGLFRWVRERKHPEPARVLGCEWLFHGVILFKFTVFIGQDIKRQRHQFYFDTIKTIWPWIIKWSESFPRGMIEVKCKWMMMIWRSRFVHFFIFNVDWLRVSDLETWVLEFNCIGWLNFVHPLDSW